MSDQAPLLQLRNVNLSYDTHQGRVLATDKISFDIFLKERFVLIGPSGCGKSSLLKAVAGFIHPSEGSIKLKGEEIKGPGPDRMVVFQEFDQLLPWKTVVENVMFPLVATRRFEKSEAHHRAMACLSKVQLAKYADNYCHTLSGGMKQRVAIARGMTMEPDILLMDEPFAALDAMTRECMQDELLALCKEMNFAVMFVTHSISEAVKIGTRILMLSANPGRVKGVVLTNSATGSEATDLVHEIGQSLFGNAGGRCD